MIFPGRVLNVLISLSLLSSAASTTERGGKIIYSLVEYKVYLNIDKTIL